MQGQRDISHYKRLHIHVALQKLTHSCRTTNDCTQPGVESPHSQFLFSTLQFCVLLQAGASRPARAAAAVHLSLSVASACAPEVPATASQQAAAHPAMQASTSSQHVGSTQRLARCRQRGVRPSRTRAAAAAPIIITRASIVSRSTLPEEFSEARGYQLSFVAFSRLGPERKLEELQQHLPEHETWLRGLGDQLVLHRPFLNAEVGQAGGGWAQEASQKTHHTGRVSCSRAHSLPRLDDPTTRPHHPAAARHTTSKLQAQAYGSEMFAVRADSATDARQLVETVRCVWTPGECCHYCRWLRAQRVHTPLRAV
jgi:hypothetical protein